MSEIVLHDFQADAVLKVMLLLDQDLSTILVAPTGGGKTVMGAEIVRRLAAGGKRVVWLAHTRELVHQASRAFHRAGITHGMIMADTETVMHPVMVASIQTVMARGWAEQYDVVVVDEAHHAVADTWSDTVRDAEADCTLGLTATPYRLDGKPLGEFFERMVVAATPRELCERGMLHAPRTFAPCTPDMRKVRKVGGDYVAAQAAAVMCDGAIVGNIVDHWRRLSPGRKTLGFACNIEHARVMSDAFIAAGIRSGYIHGGMPKPERDEVLRDHREGGFDVLWNCMILTEGWDLPALETAIIARPTASMGLHRQMIGRVMRTCPNKAGALVLDHAGNTLRHRLVTMDLHLSLEGECGFRTMPGDEVTTCRACMAIVKVSDKNCPDCGALIRQHDETLDGMGEKKKIPDHVDGELVDVGDGMAHKRLAEEWDELMAECHARGFKPGWAMYTWKERHGHWPLIHAGRLVDPMDAPQECKRDFFDAMWAAAERKGYKPGWVAHTYKSKFGQWPPRAWAAEKGVK